MDCSLRTPDAQNKLPYDIIEQIFLLCLPESPFDRSVIQPKTWIAPMLLCHVCSSWRAAALATPALWSYLYYGLCIRWENGQPIACNAKVFLRDMEFLKWWRQNQRPKAPFIRFIFYTQPEETLYEKLPLSVDDVKFFVEYLSTAQYLDVGLFVSYLFSQETNESGSLVSCPKLHSLVTNYTSDDRQWERTSGLVSFRNAPTLRRLRVRLAGVWVLDINTFTQWSGLTHLSLRAVHMFSSTWYSLLRGVSNLQWGYFDIVFWNTENDFQPPKATFPFLSTLSLTFYNHSGHGVENVSLYRLFHNLHFPALRDLAIYIDANPQWPPNVAMSINDSLESVPSLTKLTLGMQFLTFQDFVNNSNVGWENVDKLHKLAPRLAHLVLDMCNMPTWREEAFNGSYETSLPERLDHWTAVLRPSLWLDLANPESVIHKISAVVQDLSRDGPLVEAAFRSALELNVEADGKEAVNVMLEILPEDRRAVAPYCKGSEGWRTWGCSL